MSYDLTLDSTSTCLNAPDCGLVGALGAGCSFIAGVEADGTSRMPTGFFLHQNVPNPFRASTVIRFALPEGTDADLTVHDVTGREIVTLSYGRTTGECVATWDGKDASGEEVGSGIYFVRLESCEFVATQKLILLR